jgi:hypothetical protein
MKLSEPAKIVEIARTIAAQGAEFAGLQECPGGHLVLFLDPITRTTLALPECELSVEAVARRLQESRKPRALRG